MRDDSFLDRLDLHRVYLEARSQRNSFYEKLTILDGGTVALVVSAVLGPFRGNLPYKHLVAVAVTFLVLAMVVLLLRNLLAARLEFHIVGETTYDRRVDQPAMKQEQKRLDWGIRRSQTTGVILSAIGVLLLLVEVWLIL